MYVFNQRYHLLSEVMLGFGGQGVVFPAADLWMDGERVVIKCVADPLSATHEASMLAGLGDVEFVYFPLLRDFFQEEILFSGADGAREYSCLVMEYMEGITLETYLTQSVRVCLPLDEVLDVGVQLCAMLDCLHAREWPVIYGDLKLANVIRDAEGMLYLVDFGMATPVGYSGPLYHLGTPGYAAPEKWRREPLTPRSDIYSLGILLHELLTGWLPPGSRSDHFVPLGISRALQPESLQHLLRRMVAVDSERRPASVAEVGRELQRIVADRSERSRRALAS